MLSLRDAVQNKEAFLMVFIYNVPPLILAYNLCFL